MANRGSTAAELWRAYLREHVTHSERFNRVYRGRGIQLHLHAHAARYRRPMPQPRGKVWRQVLALSRRNSPAGGSRPNYNFL